MGVSPILGRMNNRVRKEQRDKLNLNVVCSLFARYRIHRKNIIKFYIMEISIFNKTKLYSPLRNGTFEVLTPFCIMFFSSINEMR